MKAKGIFISTLLVIDTFLGAYFYGVHSRSVKVIDPNLDTVSSQASKAAPVTGADTTQSKKPPPEKPGTAKNVSNDKKTPVNKKQAKPGNSTKEKARSSKEKKTKPVKTSGNKSS